MRFHADRQWSHPVLRPGTDDWPSANPEGERPRLEPPQMQPGGENVLFAFSWRPSVESLANLIEEGQAEVTGLLYCPWTWHRARFNRNGENSFRSVATIPVDQIRGRVEIHPIIVALQGDLELPVGQAHEEYRESRPVLERGTPIAVHYRWETSHDPTAPPLESFVQLAADEELPEGKFRLGSTLGNERLVIYLNTQSYHDFNQIRSTSEALASLYLSALTAACAKIQGASAIEDQLSGTNMSWNGAIDRQLANPDPDSGNAPAYIRRFEREPDLLETGSLEGYEEIEPEEAAQRLLKSPLGKLLGETRRTVDDLEEDYDGADEGIDE